MVDIRVENKKSNIQVKDSLILFIVIKTSTFLQKFSLVGHLCKFLKVTTPTIITDIWLLFILFIQITILCFWITFSVLLQKISLFVVLYFLLDSLNASTRELILVPDLEGDGSIETYNRQRWLVASFMATIEVVLSFAILILYFGHTFNKVINDSFTAIYVSFVTFFTLGYGDYVPIKGAAKVIVVGELFYFLLFLVFKLPIAVSMINIRNVIKRK